MTTSPLCFCCCFRVLVFLLLCYWCYWCWCAGVGAGPGASCLTRKVTVTTLMKPLSREFREIVERKKAQQRQAQVQAQGDGGAGRLHWLEIPYGELTLGETPVGYGAASKVYKAQHKGLVVAAKQLNEMSDLTNLELALKNLAEEVWRVLERGRDRERLRARGRD
jgi:hypothetical protein